MQLKLFVLPIKNLGVAEGEMNPFQRSHRVLAVNWLAKENTKSVPIRAGL